MKPGAGQRVEETEEIQPLVEVIPGDRGESFLLQGYGRLEHRRPHRLQRLPVSLLPSGADGFHFLLRHRRRADSALKESVSPLRQAFNGSRFHNSARPDPAQLYLVKSYQVEKENKRVDFFLKKVIKINK